MGGVDRIESIFNCGPAMEILSQHRLSLAGSGITGLASYSGREEIRVLDAARRIAPAHTEQHYVPAPSLQRLDHSPSNRHAAPQSEFQEHHLTAIQNQAGFVTTFSGATILREIACGVQRRLALTTKSLRLSQRC